LADIAAGGDGVDVNDPDTAVALFSLALALTQMVQDGSRSGDAELAAAFCAHLGRGWRCPAAISKGAGIASNSVWVRITSETFPQ
jgi:hypothetical protein